MHSCKGRWTSWLLLSDAIRLILPDCKDHQSGEEISDRVDVFIDSLDLRPAAGDIQEEGYEVKAATHKDHDPVKEVSRPKKRTRTGTQLNSPRALQSPTKSPTNKTQVCSLHLRSRLRTRQQHRHSSGETSGYRKKRRLACSAVESKWKWSKVPLVCIIYANLCIKLQNLNVSLEQSIKNAERPLI
jgi:hypothetical protein